MDFLDTDAPTVVSAGTGTAQTSTDWGSWATSARTAFDNAREGLRNGVVAVALEGYAGDVNTTASRVSSNVDTLGGNTVSAANVVHNADSDSTSHLHTQAAIADGNRPALDRPILA